MRVFLVCLMVMTGAANDLAGGEPSQASREPRYFVLHTNATQARADAELVELTLKNKLSAHGQLRQLSERNQQARTTLDTALNDLVALDTQGGLFLYFRGVAKNLRDGDFQLAVTAETEDSESLLFSELMQRLQHVRNPQPVWVFLDLETELEEQDIQNSLLKRRPQAPSVLVIAGVRTSDQEQKLTKSSQRLAHWISRGLSGEAGPSGGPRINDPASITRQGLVEYLRARLQPTKFSERPGLITSLDPVAEEPAAKDPLAEIADAGSIHQRPRSTEELVEDQAERWDARLASQHIRNVYVHVSELTDENAPGAKGSGFATGLQKMLVRQLERLAEGRPDNERCGVLDSRKANTAIAAWQKQQSDQGLPTDFSNPALLHHIARELTIDVESLAILTGRVQPPGTLEHPAEFRLQIEAQTVHESPTASVAPAFGVVTPGDAFQVSGDSFVPVLPSDSSSNLEKDQAIPMLPTDPPTPNPASLSDPTYIKSLKTQIEEHNKWAAEQIHPLKSKTLGLSLGVRRLTKAGVEQLPLNYSQDQKTVWVNLQPGDFYTINLSNNQHRDLFLRLFVDGLNTLPEPERNSNGHYRLDAQREKIWQTAAPVSPEIASYWFLKSGSKSEVKGFFSDVRQGVNANAFTFRVVPAAESEAASQGLSEEAGYITALFYDMQDVAPDVEQSLCGQRLGSAMGPKIREDLQFYEGPKIPGKLVAVIQLQYRAAAN